MNDLRKKRNRSSETTAVDSELDDEDAQGGSSKQYKSVNGKWFSRKEYEVLLKAGVLDVLQGKCSTTTGMPEDVDTVLILSGERIH